MSIFGLCVVVQRHLLVRFGADGCGVVLLTFGKVMSDGDRTVASLSPIFGFGGGGPPETVVWVLCSDVCLYTKERA